MQSSHDDPRILLTFFCKSPDSYPNPDCPSFYRSSDGGWYGQGEVRDEPGVRDQIQNMKPHEGYLWFPDKLMDEFVRQFAKERYGVDLG
ncbi:hypothetical protein BTM25_33050 [Actinomadura rubteroloni]|uniref:Uncharacterized protein n=1 Tax=Actinomadura rubteroloni TaxID=1926885 RepID=A0A2P4UI23_9ACTN|nr:hypothetical protein BTM25_33050 [Actinomadura rubteroloni]